MTDVLIKRSNMDTETDMYREKANYKPRKGTPEASRARTEAQNRISPTAQEGTSPADSLISDL